MTLVSTRERITQFDVFNDLRKIRLSIDDPDEVLSGQSEEIIPIRTSNDGSTVSRLKLPVFTQETEGQSKQSINIADYDELFAHIEEEKR